MCTGLSEELKLVIDLRKTRRLDDMAFARLNIDIVALQETRLASTGSLREFHYTFFWHGKDPEDRRENGVGFAVKNTLAP